MSMFVSRCEEERTEKKRDCRRKQDYNIRKKRQDIKREKRK